MNDDLGDPARKRALCEAVRWLSDHGRHDATAIEAACRRFDLCPADEQFLLEHFRNQQSDHGP